MPEKTPTIVISASKPTVIPAQPPITFDRWWVRSLIVDAGDPTNVSATFRLQKYSVADDGSLIFSTVDPVINIPMTDVLNSPDPNVQQAVTSILTAVLVMGQQSGRL